MNNQKCFLLVSDSTQSSVVLLPRKVFVGNKLKKKTQGEDENDRISMMKENPKTEENYRSKAKK